MPWARESESDGNHAGDDQLDPSDEAGWGADRSLAVILYRARVAAAGAREYGGPAAHSRGEQQSRQGARSADQGSERGDFQRKREKQSARAIGSDGVIAHDPQNVLRGPPAAEAIGSIGQTVEMHRARKEDVYGASGSRMGDSSNAVPSPFGDQYSIAIPLGT